LKLAWNTGLTLIKVRRKNPISLSGIETMTASYEAIDEQCRKNPISLSGIETMYVPFHVSGDLSPEKPYFPIRD